MASTAVTANSPARKPIGTLIIDAGPILSATAAPTYYLSQADRLLTTPAVVAEIRDAAARARFETQWKPFLTLRTPRAASMKLIAEFAKKTGDFAVLSRTDLELLALGYEAELEVAGGDWRLRRVPGQKEINGPVPKWWSKGGDKPPEVVRHGEDVKAGEEVKADEPTRAEEELVESVEKVQLEDDQTTTTEPTAVEEEEEEQEGENAESEEEDTSSDSSSDGGEWITPSNLHRKLNPSQEFTAKPSSTAPSRKLTVAVATIDYAMQNVLLQLNLNLCSPTNLQQIKHTRSTVLRCHACFYILRSQSAPTDFCPRCGGVKTLLRTSVSTDSDGVFRIHLKKNMQWNNRGNVYSIPKPQHGTSSMKGIPDAPVLREDQKEYQRAKRREKWRKEKDLLDPDILPGILTGDRRVGPYVKVGNGRRNPNETRRGGGKKK